jgi:hypothetical protein
MKITRAGDVHSALSQVREGRGTRASFAIALGDATVLHVGYGFLDGL